MNDSRFFVENVLMSMLVHFTLFVNWNLRITILALSVFHVFRESSINIIDKVAVLSRLMWFISLAFLTTISCVSPHCVVHNPNTYIGYMHSIILISISVMGYMISANRSLQLGWPIMVVTLLSLQIIYFSEIPCYMPMMSFINEVCYWFAVSVFRFVNNRKLLHKVSQCKRLQTISTYALLFSTNYITTFLCVLVSACIYASHSFKSVLSNTYTGDQKNLNRETALHNSDDNDSGSDDDDSDTNSIDGTSIVIDTNNNNNIIDVNH